MSLCDHTEVVGWGTVVHRTAAGIVGTVGYWRERGILEPACNKTETLKYSCHAHAVINRKLSFSASRKHLDLSHHFCCSQVLACLRIDRLPVTICSNDSTDDHEYLSVTYAL